MIRFHLSALFPVPSRYVLIRFSHKSTHNMCRVLSDRVTISVYVRHHHSDLVNIPTRSPATFPCLLICYMLGLLTADFKFVVFFNNRITVLDGVVCGRIVMSVRYAKLHIV